MCIYIRTSIHIYIHIYLFVSLFAYLSPQSYYSKLLHFAAFSNGRALAIFGRIRRVLLMKWSAWKERERERERGGRERERDTYLCVYIYRYICIYVYMYICIYVYNYVYM